jgi:hypothetical protein
MDDLGARVAQAGCDNFRRSPVFQNRFDFDVRRHA